MGKITRTIGKGIKQALLWGFIGILALLTLTGQIDWRRLFGIARTSAANVAHDVRIPSPSGPVSSPNDRAAAAQCRETLARIQSAKAAIRARTGIEVKDVSIDAVLREMGLQRLPRCPAGGTYAIGSMQQAPTCSLAATGSTDPSLAHILR